MKKIFLLGFFLLTACSGNHSKETTDLQNEIEMFDLLFKSCVESLKRQKEGLTNLKKASQEPSFPAHNSDSLLKVINLALDSLTIAQTQMLSFYPIPEPDALQEYLLVRKGQCLKAFLTFKISMKKADKIISGYCIAPIDTTLK